MDGLAGSAEIDDLRYLCDQLARVGPLSGHRADARSALLDTSLQRVFELFDIDPRLHLHNVEVHRELTLYEIARDKLIAPELE
jgi:hypothetical protein